MPAPDFLTIGSLEVVKIRGFNADLSNLRYKNDKSHREWWIPHVGLSGFIMSLLIYYALQFPKNRLAYMYRFLRVLPAGQFQSVARSVAWVRIPIGYIGAFYVLTDLAHYFLYENRGVTGTSYSGHIGGAIAGYIYWKVAAKKNLSTSAKVVKDLDLFKSKLKLNKS